MPKTGGWTLCLSDPTEGFSSIATTPEGYSLGGKVTLGATTGWLLTPPTSPEAANQLVRDSLAVEKADPVHEKYHGIFLSHTGVDKPFVRQLRKDLLAHGVPRVWLDEAELMHWVERFYSEYYFRPRVIWRVVRKALWDSHERKRLSKEAREYMALRSKRKRFISDQRQATVSANAGD